MTPFGCLTFLTDYGLEDGFVAACHGVALRIAPAARVVDITHLVPPGDVRRGATVLAQTVPAMPPAVHVAVVDPGVGTSRRAVAVAAGSSILVGPDNGLLSWAAAALGGPTRAVSLTSEALWMQPVSGTFHGRDIFMPVAAHLFGGTDISSAGSDIDPAGLVSLPQPVASVTGRQAAGEVVSVDRFGNIQLSVPATVAGQIGIRPGGSVEVRFARELLIVPYLETFAAGPSGDLVAFADSAGFVALAVTGGNAASIVGMRPGTAVRICAASRHESR